jgi:ribonuclease Z
MPSHDLAKVTIEDLDVIGYSVAGEETVVGIPQLDVCFDIGKAPNQLISINNVLLTHGHMDHAAGFAYYLSHRNFCGQSTGTILVPANLVGPINDIIAAWARLDGNRIPANIIGVRPGDEHRIKPNLVARVFPTRHCKGSVGYTVIERRKKIKPEYAKLNGKQIVELKRQGVTIDYPLEIPIVTYLGDTKQADFKQLDYIAKSKILIAECTFFIDEHTDRAEAGRHMHIGEFAAMVEQLDNEYVVVTHLTQRTAMREIRRILKKSVSEEKYRRMTLLMANRRKQRCSENAGQ